MAMYTGRGLACVVRSRGLLVYRRRRRWDEEAEREGKGGAGGSGLCLS